MSRERFDSFAHAGGGAPPFIPFGELLAQRVGNVDGATMRQDAQSWCMAVTNTARLLGAGVIAVGFDPELGMDAAKASADQPATHAPFGTFLDAVERLGQTERGWAATLAAVTGPVALAGALGADDPGAIKTEATALVEAVCQKRPDLLVLLEGGSLGQADIDNSHRKIFNAIRNVASYFDVPLALYLEDYRAETIAGLERLRVPIIILGPDANGQMPSPDLAAACAENADSVAVPLDFANPDAAMEQARDYAAALKGHSFAFTSCRSIPSDADLAEVRRLSAFLQTFSEQD